MWEVLWSDHQGIEAMVAMKETMPESRTMEMEMPSAPTKYSTLKAWIQTALATSCTPGLLPSNIDQAAMEATMEKPDGDQGDPPAGLVDQPLAEAERGPPDHHQHDDDRADEREEGGPAEDVTVGEEGT